MKKITFIIGMLALAGIAVTSCKKAEDTPAAQSTKKGEINIGYDNIAGDDDLLLNRSFTDSLGETVTISKLKYIVSNISLVASDGTVFTVPKDSSYFIVDESDENSQVLNIKNVPEADYSAIRFTIGVDSAMSASASKTSIPALNYNLAGYEMYWGDTEGYFFLKMEGNAKAQGAQAAHPYELHISGQSGSNQNVKVFNLGFNGSLATVRAGIIIPEVHLLIDAKKIAYGSTKIDLSSAGMIMGGSQAAAVANNYVNAFRVDHVHND